MYRVASKSNTIKGVEFCSVFYSLCGCLLGISVAQVAQKYYINSIFILRVLYSIV